MEGSNQRDHSCAKAWFFTWFKGVVLAKDRANQFLPFKKTCFKKTCWICRFEPSPNTVDSQGEWWTFASHSHRYNRGFGFAHFSGYGDFLSGSTGAKNGKPTWPENDKKPNVEGDAWFFTLCVVFSKKKNYIKFYISSALLKYDRDIYR